MVSMKELYYDARPTKSQDLNTLFLQNTVSQLFRFWYSLYDHGNYKWLVCISCLKCDVLTALTVQVAVHWDVLACNMVDSYHSCGGLCHLHLVLPRVCRLHGTTFQITVILLLLLLFTFLRTSDLTCVLFDRCTAISKPNI